MPTNFSRGLSASMNPAIFIAPICRANRRIVYPRPRFSPPGKQKLIQVFTTTTRYSESFSQVSPDAPSLITQISAHMHCLHHCARPETRTGGSSRLLHDIGHPRLATLANATQRTNASARRFIRSQSFHVRCASVEHSNTVSVIHRPSISHLKCGEGIIQTSRMINRALTGLVSRRIPAGPSSASRITASSTG